MVHRDVNTPPRRNPRTWPPPAKGGQTECAREAHPARSAGFPSAQLVLITVVVSAADTRPLTDASCFMRATRAPRSLHTGTRPGWKRRKQSRRRTLLIATRSGAPAEQPAPGGQRGGTRIPRTRCRCTSRAVTGRRSWDRTQASSAVPSARSSATRRAGPSTTANGPRASDVIKLSSPWPGVASTCSTRSSVTASPTGPARLSVSWLDIGIRPRGSSPLRGMGALQVAWLLPGSRQQPRSHR